jgi:cellobiose-specific phosphotransferase system component IIC
VRFFRHSALLLPSAFLLGVLLFLLTHGREDPGFATYPFFEQWSGSRSSTPEFRFLEQALVFFLPLYLVSLLFVLLMAVAETALYGARRPVARSIYDRAFRKVFPALYMITVAALVLVGDRLSEAYAPGALVGPLLVSVTPFLGALFALLPALLLAGPAAALMRMERA